MKSTEIIQALTSTLGAFAILWGVGRFLWDRHRKASVEEVGAITLDERQMGYFHVEIPNPLYSLQIWTRKTAERPILPCISLLLVAGDMHVFTSSMFDWINSQLSGNAVGWKSLYEAFFRELAWLPLEDNKAYAASVRCALKRAKKAVDNVRTVTGDPKLADRHVHYDKLRHQWNGFSTSVNNSTKYCLEKSNGYKPVKRLTNCVVSLDAPNGWKAPAPFISLLGPDQRWCDDFQEVWIQSGRPYIQASAVEIAALALVLGVRLKLQRNRDNDVYGLSGRGAFGVGFRTEVVPHSGLLKLHIVQEKRIPRHEATKGSGYSTLYAKQMACNKLPFALSDGYVHAIEISKGLCQNLRIRKSGFYISDGSYRRYSASTNYLRLLPHAWRTYFYSTSMLTDQPQEYGRIFGKHHQPVGWWHDAVAHIAFRGLVPMAAVDLVDAVRTTVLERIELKAGFYISLTQLLLEVQRRTESSQLFGQYVKDRTDAMLYPKVILDAQCPCEVDNATAASLFGRYTTMLEYLTANAFDAKDDAVREVFEACSKEIEKAYKDEVADSVVSSEDIVTDLQELCQQIDRAGHCSVIECGRIARYIIMAWSHYVVMVGWDKNDKNEAEKAEKLAKAACVCKASIELPPSQDNELRYVATLVVEHELSQHSHHELDHRIYEPESLRDFRPTYIVA